MKETEKSGPASESARTKRGIKRAAIIAIVTAIVVAGGFWGYRQLDADIQDYNVKISPEVINADGVSSALLEIELISRFGNRLNVRALPHAPELIFPEGGDLVKVMSLGDSLTYRLIAKYETGRVVARVKIYGAPGPIEATLDLVPSLADRNDNGYPDVLDLTAESDRVAFRRWFTTIASGQMTHIDDRWHDRDCAGLIRYCYREALKRHDNAWLAGRKWLTTASIPDVKKYNYPSVPLVGTRVFNAGWRQEQGDTPAIDASNDPRSRRRSRPRRSDPLATFSEFAEAARLKDNSLQFLSRSPEEALPGDVIFYLNDTESDWPYHTMIYLGNGMTVYHTGPDDGNPGIVKKLSLEDLASHPNRRWHPVESNPYFLGFYRWRILM